MNLPESSRDANIPATAHNPNDHQSPMHDPRLDVKECCSGNEAIADEIQPFPKESFFHPHSTVGLSDEDIALMAGEPEIYTSEYPAVIQNVARIGEVIDQAIAAGDTVLVKALKLQRDRHASYIHHFGGKKTAEASADSEGGREDRAPLVMQNVTEIERELEKTHLQELQSIRFDMYTLDELRKTNFTNDALFDPFLPRTGVAAVVGMPDSGKSMLCRQLALSLVHGKGDFLGFPLKPKHKRAIFVTTEDTIEATRACFVRQSDAMTSNAKPLHEQDLVILLGDDMTTDEILERLESLLARLPFDLVVVDAFGDVFKGGEGNSNIANRNSLRPFSILAKKYSTCVLFVHHTNKGARHAAPDHIHVQGGSGFVQKVRSVLELRSKKDNGGIKYLVCTKGNGVSHKTKSQAIELLFDDKTFIYKYSGMKIPVENLRTDKNEASVKIKIDAKEIFAPHEITLKRNEIVKRAQKRYGFSESTIIRWITDTLVLEEYATYKNPNFILSASESIKSVSMSNTI